MADDRSRPVGADDVHDDDELADVLAAELQRYATGVVPVVPPAPPSPVGSVRVDWVGAPAEEGPLPSPRPSGRRAAEPAEPPAGPPPADVPPAFERSGRRVQDVLTWATGEHQALPAAPVDEPVRRRRGYLPPSVGSVPPVDPLERVLPTGPVLLPEPTAALLHEMVADQGGPPDERRARHASPASALRTPPVGTGVEALRSTGPLTVPRPLYSDWEQSLRSIGRPRAPWEDDEDPVPTGGASPDAPTVALPVTRDRPAARPPVDEPAPTGRVRRARRRAEEAPPALPAAAAPAPLPVVTDVESDDDGVDDVATEHRHVSAATSGAIDLPMSDPRPRTAPLLIERVRTAILQLPVMPASPTGSAGPGIAGRWTGAFASPLLLLLAVGLATAGAGPLDLAPVLVGALLVLPSAVRSAAWSAGASPRDLEEREAFGAGAGAAWAAVLLLARLAAAAGALFAVSSLVSAWVARTGVLGGSVSTAGLLATVVVGLIALLGALLPVRALAIAVQVVGALSVVGTVLLVLLLAPSASGGAGGAPAAAAAGGAAIGLVLLLCGADVARWRTGIASTVGSAVGTVLGAAAGVVVLGLGLLVATGASGDPADAFASALSDGSAAGLATPLAVVLLGAAVVLPVLLVRSAAASGARLLGSGERLGTVAAGLLALAGALGLLAAGIAVAPGVLAVAGLAGVPVAAWAGVRTTGGAGRSGIAAAVAAIGVLVGWLLVDGLVPGAVSPVLAALPAALRGGPALGFAAALAIGLAAGLVSRSRDASAPGRGADTVEG